MSLEDALSSLLLMKIWGVDGVALGANAAGIVHLSNVAPCLADPVLYHIISRKRVWYGSPVMVWYLSPNYVAALCDFLVIYLKYCSGVRVCCRFK